MNWNIPNWSKQMIPSLIRKEPFTNYVDVVVNSITNVYNQFVAYRFDTIKKLQYNGQSIILENLLNDTFDLVDRNIQVITASDIDQPVYIATPAETSPVYIATPGESSPVYIGLPGEYGYTYDFLVLVPTGILTGAQEVQLKAITNYYKIAGKKARFQYTDNTIF